jgi:hypothetical protein
MASWQWGMVFLAAFLLTPKITNGQAQILCSNEIASFEEYEPIRYPSIVRAAGVTTSFKFTLNVLPGGRFEYKIIHPLEETEIGYELQKAVVNAFSGWKFLNDSKETLDFILNVDFELLGRVSGEDSMVKNKIKISKDGISIRVIATRIVLKVG